MSGHQVTQGISIYTVKHGILQFTAQLHNKQSKDFLQKNTK